MFLSMLLMDSDPHSYGSICGKSIVVTSYSMKPLRSSKVVKVMFIIDYTHVHMLGNFWIITNLGWFGFTIRLLSLKRVMLLVVCRCSEAESCGAWTYFRDGELVICRLKPMILVSLCLTWTARLERVV
jgi:hypothetical protein